jgi:hypothetical protein
MLEPDSSTTFFSPPGMEERIVVTEVSDDEVGDSLTTS